MIGLIGSVVALVGWFGFHSVITLIIGTVIYIIETIIEWKELNMGAKLFDILLFVIGSIIALIVKTPFYIGGMIAIAIYSAIISIITLPTIIKRTKEFFTIVL